jgi:periodic tryptophan protein 1
MILSRDLDLGKTFGVQFGPDADVGMTVVVAGNMGSIKMWDLSTSNAVRRAVGMNARSGDGVVEDGKLLRVDEGSDDDDEEEGQMNWEP